MKGTKKNAPFLPDKTEKTLIYTLASNLNKPSALTPTELPLDWLQ